MRTNNMFFRLLVICILMLSACSKTPVIDNATMLDGDQIFDPSLYSPELYLVSVAIDNPSEIQKNTPVIIAAHGYSSSTYEWEEFRSYCEANNVLISQVLLGGHGRTYADFKKSTWEDWQEPIMTEYNALRDKGYTNINFVGSSTACPLVLDLIKTRKISENGMKHIFLVDPIVVSSDKLLTIIGVAGPMLGYMETTMTPAEEGHYYCFRPQETLQQLMKLIDKTRRDLQLGYELPSGIRMKIYKSIKDPTADAVSAVLIKKGLKNSDGSKIDVEMIESELHVMTRLNGRENVSQFDRDNQAHIFDDMCKIIGQ